MVDCIWTVGMIMHVMMVNESDRTLKQNMVRYIYGGMFFIDAFSTFPSMIAYFYAVEWQDRGSYFKFLRCVDFAGIFMPIKRSMWIVCPNKTKYQMDTLFSFFLIFAFVVLATHVFACFWVYLGEPVTDAELLFPIEEKDTWLFKNIFHMDPNVAEEQGLTLDDIHRNLSASSIFIFAFYWVLESITTVGYGDYAGSNAAEFLATLIFEMAGVAIFSILTAKMQH